MATRRPCSAGGNGSAGGAVTSATKIVSSGGASSISARVAWNASRARSHECTIIPPRTIGPTGGRGR